MESFIKHVLGEMRVIADARVAFSTALLVAIGVVWWVMDWRYSGVISHRDSEIALLKSVRDAYKEKLGGASPDEARARLDALEAYVKKLEPRRVNAEQRADFIRALKGNPGKALVLIETGCGDCSQYGEDFVSMLNSVPGWQALTGTISSPTKRAATGVGIRIADQGNPSPHVAAIVQALRQARIPFDTLSGSRGGMMTGPRGSEFADIELHINPKLQN